MLILGRREGESILIDGGIRIVVVSCDRGGVRLGIEAPGDVKILRGEIAQQVAQENQRAAAASVDATWLAQLGAPTVVRPASTAAPSTAAASTAEPTASSPTETPPA